MKGVKNFLIFFFLMATNPHVGFSQEFEYPSYLSENTINRLELIRTSTFGLDLVKGIAAVNCIVIQANKAIVRPDDDLYGAITDAMDDEDFNEAIEIINGAQAIKRNIIDRELDLAMGESKCESVRNMGDECVFLRNYREMINRTGSANNNAGSVGEPHLTTLDGLKYDFQSVGEYILCKTNIRGFEIQTRQKAYSKNVSCNSAVAVNIFGDTVCFYISDFPDSKNSRLYINGKAAENKDISKKLRHKGGQIVYENGTYIIKWFTGEKAIIKFYGNLIDVLVYPPYSSYSIYEGLLGSYNRNQEDDLKINGGKTIGKEKKYFDAILKNTASDGLTGDAYEKYQKKLNLDFGNSWRINKSNSLFGYPAGTSTDNFTDLNFPENHEPLKNISASQKENAKKKCIQAGVGNAEMHQCIYDFAQTGDDTFIKSALGLTNIVSFTKQLGLDLFKDIKIPPVINKEATDKVKKGIFKRIKF
jgi:hypothetical protein